MNRVALVTGGAGGIGSAICRGLAADGLDVAIGYHHNRSGAVALAAECAGLGVRALPIGADLTDPDAVADMFGAVADGLGGLDVFVHNAAIAVFARLGKASRARWDRAFAVNVDALHLALGQVAERMRDGGRVITVSSLNSVTCLPGSGAYAASKAAAEALTRVAARELGHRGITANCLQLGVVDTPASRAVLTEAAFGPIAARTAMQRIGEPADVAALVGYLVGPAAGWITGQTLRLDGGLAAVG